MSQNPEAIPSKNTKTKTETGITRHEEVTVTISKKYEPSMESEVRFHLALPKCDAEKMQTPLQVLLMGCNLQLQT